MPHAFVSKCKKRNACFWFRVCFLNKIRSYINHTWVHDYLGISSNLQLLPSRFYLFQCEQCICVCVWAFVCVCVCVFVSACVYLCVSVHGSVFVCIYFCVCICVYVCVCVCVCMFGVCVTGSVTPGLACARGRYCPAGTQEEMVCPQGTFTPHQGALSINHLCSVLWHSYNHIISYCLKK